MKKLLLLLLLCHVSSAVKHSLKYFYTVSSGVPNLPEFVAAVVVDDTLAGYCDSNTKRIEPKQEWVKQLFQNDPKHLEWYNAECLDVQLNFFRATIERLKQRFNQTGGVHILQRMSGCEWDDETGEVNGFNQYGYDGEDFIAFDLKTSTWITPRPQAVATKLKWDAAKARITYSQMYLTRIFPDLLKKYLAVGKSFLLRTELPSVSLLQKTPSSPVSCHATGFHPKRAVMFWRKDGEELHEHVDYGETLPNHDGTFQMSVDLDLSSVPAADWGRYDCVFQLSGVKEDITTRLETDKIWTNWVEPSDLTVPITAGLILLVLVAAAGFIVYRKKRAQFCKSPDCRPACDNDSELSKELNTPE